MKKWILLVFLFPTTLSLYADEPITIDSLVTLLEGDWILYQSVDACSFDITDFYYSDLTITITQGPDDLGTDRISATLDYNISGDARVETTKYVIFWNDLFVTWQMEDLTSTDVYPDNILNLILENDNKELIISWADACTACNCGQIDYFSRTGSPVGIEELSDLSWNISPNPAATFLNVELPAGIAVQNLHIYALDGRLVKALNSPGSTTIRVSIAELPAGSYVIELISDAGVLSRQVVVE